MRVTPAVRRRRRSSVRARIAIACAGLFLVLGATLIGTTFTLVSHVRVVQSSSPAQAAPASPSTRGQWAHPVVCPSAGRRLARHFLASSLAGLALGTMLAGGLGWAVSGRVLRPLRALPLRRKPPPRRTWASGWRWPGRPMS